MRATKWTHPSVFKLAGDRDPIQSVTQAARSLVLDALQAGWAGPPFDPFALADFRKISVSPRDDVTDARTVPVPGGLRIEFNPNKPQSRIRYSICHELAHSLFPDCRDAIRNRARHEQMASDEWQLEMLCNIGAAELLMPIGSFTDLESQPIEIDSLLERRKQYGVSTEALCLRIVHLTQDPCCLISFSRNDDASDRARYQVDYSVPSQAWNDHSLRSFTVPRAEVVRECTAIGWTAKGRVRFSPISDEFALECVGIPPYPNQRFPRVLGIAKAPRRQSAPISSIRYLVGDALEPRGPGRKLIVHVVNDKGHTWGAGFALAIRKKWPDVQEDFREWASRSGHLALGNLHATTVGDDLAVVHLICQHGYGPSVFPRIRYGMLEACLAHVADRALSECIAKRIQLRHSTAVVDPGLELLV